MSQFQVYRNISALTKVLENKSRVFLVTGKNSYKDSGAKEEIDNFLIGKNVYQHTDFAVNPNIDDLVNGSSQVYDFQPDLIIAIGGGSVLDTAKLIAVLPPDKKNCEKTIGGKIAVIPRQVPLVAIPTTAGSGSECTHFAVAYIGLEKYSVTHSKLIPDYVFLDARFTYSTSPYLTAVTGMDAFSQAIESFWAVGATNKSREYAREAIAKILSVFPKVVHKPDPHSREIMLEGAHLAGKAINISKTTGPHALSYILTQLFNIPHGHAVALSLPEFLEINFSEEDSGYNGDLDLHQLNNIKSELLFLLNCKTVIEVKIKMEQLLTGAGLKTKLSALGAIEKIGIQQIVESVNLERLQNNPKIISRKHLVKIIKNIS